MNELNITQVKEMFAFMADEIMKNETLLTEMDNKIGDGDHGIGMSLGFRAVKENLPNMKADSVNELFKEVGMTMLDAMGGASGVIFGTMFISGFGAVPPAEKLTLETLGFMMKRSLDNIKKRGKAKLGDKTMIDSYEPAVRGMLESAERGDSLLKGLQNAWTEAVKGAEKTKTYSARKGRAESYGQKSLGVPDPGAVSVSILFRAMYEYVKGHEEGGKV
ncbi:MAG: dihydroxyacetone kinase subunit DhaL [Lachnospiraceae bacterium]|jgi:dihydroxyacetone kinase phosphoprotein-dependent L subunit|nr:dihydroxyacetone kinase subunit DhaL [Lachnospiraceae bacterium]